MYSNVAYYMGFEFVAVLTRLYVFSFIIIVGPVCSILLEMFSLQNQIDV